MKRDGASTPNLRRNPGVDALRTLAILGMMSTHTSRLIVYQSREAWSHWGLLLEPLIPSLFLFLVGVSLNYSLARSESRSENPRTWYLRQARRALMLWLIGALFSALEYGIRLPDVFLASGILCTIAYSILLLGAVLLLPFRGWVAALLLLGGSAAFFLVNRSGTNPFPWVSGDSPILPLSLFAAAGTLWGLWSLRKPVSIYLLAAPALVFVIWAVNHYGWLTLFTYPVGRSDATRVLAAPITGGLAKVVGYYNLRPLLSLFCLCAHLAALGIACLAFSRLKETWAGRLFILGRHSLEIYILHLSLLAILVVTLGLQPLKTPWQGNAVILGVICICLFWCFMREKWRSKRKLSQSL